jgi:hypothetical protein
MLRVVENRVRRRHEPLPGAVVFARIQVAIEPWEIAARHLEPQRVTLLEHVARGPDVDRELVDLARCHQFRRFLRVAISRSQNAIRQVLCEPIRPDVYELCREIRVYR